MPKAKEKLFLIIILITAILVRLIGINPGYPLIHPDESITYSGAIDMIVNGNINPNRFDYPAGVPLIHNLIFRIFFLPLSLLKNFLLHPTLIITAITNNANFLAKYRVAIFGQQSIFANHWSRAISALFGAASVFLTYLVGKKIFSKKAGLIAAFFLTFNYRHVLSSHLGLTDIHNAFFTLLSFYTALLLLEKNSRRRYLLAGVVAGFCFSIKYQFFHFLPLILVHLIWAIKRKSFKYLFRLQAWEALAAGLLTFLIINPYFLPNIKQALKEINYVSLRYGMGRNLFSAYPLFYLYHWGIGHLSSLLIIIGSLTTLFLYPTISLLILSYVLPYFLVMIYCSGGGGYTRNFTVVIPLLMLYAGFFLSQIYIILKRLVKHRLADLIIIFALIIANFQPITNALLMDYHYSLPWNHQRLENWLLQNLPSKINLRSYPIYASFESYKAFKSRKVNISDWSYSEGLNNLAEFQKAGTDFAILGKGVNAITYWWYNWEDYKRYFQIKDIPFDFIESSFFGLSFREFRNYTVAEFYKPWQAYEDAYLVFKLPPLPKNIGHKITGFNFNSSADSWSLRSAFGFAPPLMSWTNNEGRNNKGALVISDGRGIDTARLASSPLKIKPNRLYTVKGWIKNVPTSGLNDEPSDGFIRIDLYSDPVTNPDKLGDQVAISDRAPINNQWNWVQASIVAPAESNYLTVSFQIKESQRNYRSFLDDVEIYESESLLEDKFPNIPYIKSTIPLSSLYRNGFL